MLYVSNVAAAALPTHWPWAHTHGFSCGAIPLAAFDNIRHTSRTTLTTARKARPNAQERLDRPADTCCPQPEIKNKNNSAAATSDWCANVVAAGGCTVKHKGKRYHTATPAIARFADADPVISARSRRTFSLYNVRSLLRLEITGGE